MYLLQKWRSKSSGEKIHAYFLTVGIKGHGINITQDGERLGTRLYTSVLHFPFPLFFYLYVSLSFPNTHVVGQRIRAPSILEESFTSNDFLREVKRTLFWKKEAKSPMDKMDVFKKVMSLLSAYEASHTVIV